MSSPLPRALPRALAALSAAVLAVVLGWSAPAAADHVLPPGIPGTPTAQSQLDSLTVRAKGPRPATTEASSRTGTSSTAPAPPASTCSSATATTW